MRWAWVAVLALVWVGVTGCVGPGYEQAVQERYAQKLEAWKVANPEKDFEEAVGRALMEEAVAEIKAELAEVYGEGAMGVVSSAASGNIVAAVWGGLGLLGVFLGLKKPKAAGGVA